MDIAEILKDKPIGTKLWSPLFGYGCLQNITESTIFIKPINENLLATFTREGKYLDTDDGECLLFPSKYMRDWSKLAWKRGDILANKEGSTYCIFKDWYKEDYTQANVMYWVNPYGRLFENQPLVDSLHLVEPDKAKYYIKIIEAKFNVKICDDSESLKFESDFKPFDKVLVKDVPKDAWNIDFFGKYEPETKFPYRCLSGSYKLCIPYEGNENLLGFIHKK